MKNIKLIILSLCVFIFLITSCTTNQYTRGTELFSEDKIEKSSEAFQSYIDNNTEGVNKAGAYLGLAWNYYCQGDFDYAISNCNVIVEQFPRDDITGWAYIILGYSLMKQDKIKDAVEVFNKNFIYNRNSVWAEESLYMIAYIQYRDYDFRKAIRSYNDLINSYPRSEYAAQAYYEIGDSYYQLRRYELAITNYIKVLNEFPNYPQAPLAALRSAVFYESKGNYDATKKFLNIILDNYSKKEIAAQAAVKLGNIYFEEKDHKNGIKNFEFATTEYPDNQFSDEAFYGLGMINYNQAIFKKEKYKVAEEYFSKFKTSFPNSSYREKALELLYETYKKLNKIKEQEALSETFAQDYPMNEKSTEILYDISKDHYDNKNWEEASESTEKLFDNPQLDKNKKKESAKMFIDIHKNHTGNEEKLLYGYKVLESTQPSISERKEYLMEYGDLAAKYNDDETATESYTTLFNNTSEKNEKIETAFKAANLLKKNNKNDDAIDYYFEIIDYYPESDKADLSLLSIADIYKESGNKFKAEITYEKVIKNYPDRTSAAKAEYEIALLKIDSGDKESAVKRLYKIINNFPKTEEAEKADKLLKEIQ